MYRKTRDAKAAGNLMLFEHGIGGEPEAKAFGQDLRLVNTGLGHEDDEFIPTVTGNYVRLAAFLLEQAADASQYEIAFEVSERIIHFFEFVEVYQHHGEWTTRTGGALPF